MNLTFSQNGLTPPPSWVWTPTYESTTPPSASPAAPASAPSTPTVTAAAGMDQPGPLQNNRTSRWATTGAEVTAEETPGGAPALLRATSPDGAVTVCLTDTGQPRDIHVKRPRRPRVIATYIVGLAARLSDQAHERTRAVLAAAGADPVLLAATTLPERGPVHLPPRRATAEASSVTVGSTSGNDLARQSLTAAQASSASSSLTDTASAVIEDAAAGIEEIHRARGRIADLRAEADSPCGGARAIVDGCDRLLSVELSDNLSLADMGPAVLAAWKAAASEAQRRRRAILSDTSARLGGGFSG